MNCKFQGFFIVAIFLLNFNTHSLAQNNNEDSQQDTAYTTDDEEPFGGFEEISEDTIIRKTVFEAGTDSFREWKNSNDFRYMKYLDSLLKKQTGLRTDTVSIDKSTGKKRRAGPQVNNSANFLNSLPLKIFFWIAAVFFIGFIIYKLFLTDSFFAKRNIKIAEESSEEMPHGLDEYSKYNELVHEAEAKNDFNLSTRYLYLQTLKRLADHELISYAPDKTNYSYVREISGKSYLHDFASLTLNYEYVWYGKFNIDPVRYRELKEQFILFNKKV